MDQPKLERLLRLMKMLTANNSLTVDEIADKLGISSRSVYRYISTHFARPGLLLKKRTTAPNSINPPLFLQRQYPRRNRQRQSLVSVKRILQLFPIARQVKNKSYL